MEQNRRILSPGENEINVWYAYVPRSMNYIQHYTDLLSEEEVARARRFKFDRDRNRFIFGHGLLRKLIGSYLGTPPAEIIITRNSFGKPQIINSSSDQSLRFNMSHSGELMTFVFACFRNVGIDVERVDPRLKIADIIPSLFAPDEAGCFDSVDDSDRLGFILRLWTAKEAYVKAKGVGLSEPFDSMSFNVQPNGAVKLEWALHDYDISRWNLTPLQVGDEYVGMLVYDGPAATVIHRTWETA